MTCFNCNMILHYNIDPTPVNSFHSLLNVELSGLDYHFITREYRRRVHCKHMCHLFCNTLVQVIYSVVSGSIFVYNIIDP